MTNVELFLCFGIVILFILLGLNFSLQANFDKYFDETISSIMDAYGSLYDDQRSLNKDAIAALKKAQEESEELLKERNKIVTDNIEAYCSLDKRVQELRVKRDEDRHSYLNDLELIRQDIDALRKAREREELLNVRRTAFDELIREQVKKIEEEEKKEDET